MADNLPSISAQCEAVLQETSWPELWGDGSRHPTTNSGITSQSGEILPPPTVSTVKLQHNGQPPSASKSLVYGTCPLFSDPDQLEGDCIINSVKNIPQNKKGDPLDTVGALADALPPTNSHAVSEPSESACTHNVECASTDYSQVEGDNTCINKYCLICGHSVVHEETVSDEDTADAETNANGQNHEDSNEQPEFSNVPSHSYQNDGHNYEQGEYNPQSYDSNYGQGDYNPQSYESYEIQQQDVDQSEQCCCCYDDDNEESYYDDHEESYYDETEDNTHTYYYE